MRIVKILAIAVGALVALLVVALVAVLLFVDPNKYRGDIERAAKEHTGRDLKIGGELHLKVFPWVALSVGGVELSNPAGYGNQPFMAVKNASIGVKLLPLLGSRIEVSRISLDGVSIHLVSRKADENNWKDLSEPKEGAQSAPASSGGSTGTVSIEGVDLSDSSLVYEDEVKKSTTEIGGLTLHTGSLHMSPSRTALDSVELKGTYLSRSADTKAGDQPKPLPFSLTTGAVAMDSAAQTLAPVKVAIKLGDASVQIEVSGEKMSTDKVLTGSISIPQTSARELMKSAGIDPPVTRDSTALSKFAFQTNFRSTQKQMQLSALQLTLDDTQVAGTAAVEDLDTNALAFDLKVNAINVDRYRAPVPKEAAGKKPAAAAAPAAAAPPTPLPVDTLRKLDVKGTLHVGSATVSNLVFTDITLPLTAKDGRVRLGPTAARMYGGSYNGDIVLDAQPATATLSLNEHVHTVDIGALVKAAVESDRLQGHADMNIVAMGAGNTDVALERSLSGKFDANVKQGAVVGVDLVYELQRVNTLLKRQVPAARTGTGPARTAFNVLTTNGTLDKGVLNIANLQMETDFLKVHGKGTLDTVSEAIDYQLVTAVNKVPTAGAGAAPAGGSGLDALASLEVPLTITGTMANPTVRPDIEALAKGKLGQEVQQKAGDLVKKKLGDQLKGLLGH